MLIHDYGRATVFDKISPGETFGCCFDGACGRRTQYFMKALEIKANAMTQALAVTIESEIGRGDEGFVESCLIERNIFGDRPCFVFNALTFEIDTTRLTAPVDWSRNGSIVYIGAKAYLLALDRSQESGVIKSVRLEDGFVESTPCVGEAIEFPKWKIVLLAKDTRETFAEYDFSS